MGHGFHQMSPVQEPTALYNTVIHLHQWLKNEAETCRQCFSFCYEQHFEFLTKMYTTQPNKTQWWSNPLRKQQFDITSWSKGCLFLLFYCVCPICTLIIRNAWRVWECGLRTHSPAIGCCQRLSQRKLSLRATGAVTTNEYWTLYVH